MKRYKVITLVMGLVAGFISLVMANPAAAVTPPPAAFPNVSPVAADGIGIPRPDLPLTVEPNAVTITTCGQVIRRTEFMDRVTIDTPSTCTTPVSFFADKFHGDAYYGLLVSDTSGPVLVQNSLFTGSRTQAAGGGMKILDSEFTGSFSDGVVLGDNSTLQHNWLHAFATVAGEHADGVQVQSGVHDTLIKNNRIVPAEGNTGAGDTGSAVFIAPDLGGPGAGPLKVQDNYLDGGNYTLYFLFNNKGTPADPSDDWHQAGGYVQRNVFGPNHTYGNHNVTETVIWTSNTDELGNPVLI